ncbi:IS110 family transposase [Williamsia muralis]|uniref:IS110 family transposase n=1 Tax=Williamsia marianensis TaxID=85044 RepID=UPI000DE5E423|nr:IS110 family transposase [Williamsia marianensis]PVY24754.1 transposase IS116/IS110/IS902 family protein [Williamsia marianensis]
MTDTTYDVYCGIDVGKTMHHAIALRPDGSRILSREIPQDEDQIRDLVGELGAHGSVIVVVDQPRNIGALPLAVARNCGADLAYLPGLRMRRIADLYAGSAKTDARDAYVIADAARTLPGTLVPIDSRNEVVEGLRILAGFDADLAVEENRLINRLRSLLLSIHPSLERAIGRHLHRPIGPGLLAKFGGPEGLSNARPAAVRKAARQYAPRTGDAVAASITNAMKEQTVVVPGAAKADFVISTLARQLLDVRAARAELESQFETELARHPHGPIITSMPGVGPKTAATILVEISDIRRFDNPGRLAVYAGVAPRTHRSGSSIRGDHHQRGGNTRLKRAMYLAAFASLRRPESRNYYDRKRAEGKTHHAALICLARRRSNVLYAMLKNEATYQTAHDRGAEVCAA